MTSELAVPAPRAPMYALRLRAIVAAVGESANPPWWKTKFMNETGLRFLERLYPRSAWTAAVNAAGSAAREIHDRAVGRVRVYHLFRLPEIMETEICRAPEARDEDFTAQFRDSLAHSDKMMQLLSEFYPAEKRLEGGFGALRLGSHIDLITGAALENTAAAYHRAFESGKRVFPYFDAETSV